MTIREEVQDGVQVDDGVEVAGIDMRVEAVEWLGFAIDARITPESGHYAQVSIAASLIRIGDLLEAMKEG